MFNKYDAFDRVVYSGFYSGHQTIKANLKTLRDLVNAGQKNETKLTSNATIDNITIRYSNQAFPNSNLKLLTINYYDDYLFPNAPTSFPTIEEAVTLQKVKGLLTGNWTRTLTTDSSNAGDLSYTLYDYKFRPVSTFVQNHKGGSTTVNSKLNFRGLPTKTVTTHKQTNSATELKIVDEFTYDKRERLLTQKQTINSQAPELIVSNVYDELGVLVTKDVGGLVNQTLNQNESRKSLQKVDYKYNIRGWLIGINPLKADSENDLFKYIIYYNNKIEYSTEELFNGNINGVSWLTSIDNDEKGYSYTYDHLNRLKTADFLKLEGPRYPPSLKKKEQYKENLTYDKNGNITHLNRTEKLEDESISIDELTYIYEGNQLKSVSDATNSPDGFKDGNKIGDDFAYDSFGNITIDKNKGITSIKYNHLNMPKEIVFNTGKIEYTYDAAGTRLSKKVTPTGGTAVTTDYLGGFQYVNNVLKFFPHTEGYIEFKNNQYLYTYQYKDHLGNVRLTYRDGFIDHETLENSKNGTIEVNEIIDQTDYYPFGLKHNKDSYSDYSNKNKYKYAYNGKELNDELGVDLYDFGARNYDPALGRWLNVDPLAEQMRRHSPYNYAFNNPVYFIDPDRMAPWGFDSYGRDLVKTGAIASWKLSSIESFTAEVTYGDTQENNYTRYISGGEVKRVEQTGTEGGDKIDIITDVDLDKPMLEVNSRRTYPVNVEETSSSVNTPIVHDAGKQIVYRGPGYKHTTTFKNKGHAIEPMDLDSPFFVIGGALQTLPNIKTSWKFMNSGLPKYGKFQYGIRNTKTNFQLRVERHRLQTARGGELGIHINYGIGGKKHYFPFNSGRYKPYVNE